MINKKFWKCHFLSHSMINVRWWKKWTHGTIGKKKCFCVEKTSWSWNILESFVQNHIPATLSAFIKNWKRVFCPIALHLLCLLLYDSITVKSCFHSSKYNVLWSEKWVAQNFSKCVDCTGIWCWIHSIKLISTKSHLSLSVS